MCLFLTCLVYLLRYKHLRASRCVSKIFQKSLFFPYDIDIDMDRNQTEKM